MTSSAWYSVWIKALNGVQVGTVDGPALTKAMQAASAMLENDPDYTNGDRNSLTSNIADAARQINTLLSAQNPDYATLKTAITAAEQPEGTQSPAPQSPNVGGAAAIGAARRSAMIVTPERLAQQLRTLTSPPP